jgi:hypothetical protein
MSIAPAAPRVVQTETTARTTPTVKVWATIGALAVAFDLFFLIKWVTGPRFERVQPGVDSPPDAMHAGFIAAQIVLPLAMLWCFWHFLIRPWVRERRIPLDGMLCVAFLLVSPWDPLSNYGQVWFTYNSDLFNMGSIVGELPGILGRHEAGAGEAWSILAIMPIYVAVFIGLSILICRWMTAVKRRHPDFGWIRMILVCLTITIVADIVIEGLILTRTGFYAFSGGHFLINAGHFYQFPVHEAIFGGAVFASFVCLRYFRNDKGETIVERGIDSVDVSAGRKTGLRMLAVIGAVHLGFLFCYHVPTGLFGVNSTAWPQDVVERSYFTNNVCGPKVDRACPGPATPIAGRGMPYLDFEGNLVRRSD